MLNGVMLLWFLLTGLSVLYVAIDIQSTPESPVLKWGFILLTAYIGPLGASSTCWAVASPYRGCMNAMSRSAGARCLARLCTAWRAMA